MKNKLELIVVIPVFNEEQIIKNVIKKVSQRAEACWGCEVFLEQSTTQPWQFAVPEPAELIDQKQACDNAAGQS